MPGIKSFYLTIHLFLCLDDIIQNKIFSFSHSFWNVIISFFSTAESYFIVCIYHDFIIHSFIVEHFGWFYLLAIVNKVEMDMDVWVSLKYAIECF